MRRLELTPTLEDYLEAILQITSVHQVARSMEIAEKLRVKRSSVTAALRSLADKGLINYQARSFVTLTEPGLKAAKCVDKRHHILHDVFTDILMLPEDDADTAACAMEHGMNAKVCRKMTALLMAFKSNSQDTKKVSDSLESNSQKIDCNKNCNYVPSPAPPSHEAQLFDLNSINPGESATIDRIIGSGVLKKRLREMGIIRGQKIVVVRSAPLDDPIQIRVRNFNLSLRREEAATVLVEKG